MHYNARMDIFSQAVSAFPRGAKLPGTGYVIKGSGKRHHEKAIVYYIPNSKRPTEPDLKGFTAAELRRAHRQLSSAKSFTRSWFESEVVRKNFSAGAPCNFLAMGAVFVGLDLADKTADGLFAHRPPISGTQKNTCNPASIGI